MGLAMKLEELKKKCSVPQSKLWYWEIQNILLELLFVLEVRVVWGAVRGVVVDVHHVVAAALAGGRGEVAAVRSELKQTPQLHGTAPRL